MAVVMSSSARKGYVNSWYGRVLVVRSWTFDEGRWRRSSCGDTARCLMLVSWDRSRRWMQLDSRRRQRRSVESLRKAEVGRVVLVTSRYSESSWLVVAMLGQSVTASRYVDWMLYSWGRSSRCVPLDGRCGQLRSVESLVNRCPGFDISMG